jgi:deoxyribose-phosphate aldolase
MQDLAQLLDFANHHADATVADIQKLCASVMEHGFHAAFVNPIHVETALAALSSKAPVGTVISFPLGQDTTATKMAAANNAVSNGTSEIDVVPNLGAFMAGNKDEFLKDMTNVVESARIFGKPVIVKFILDPGYFDALPNKKEALQEAARIVQQSGADFVKIGSGMGPRNPTVEDLLIIKEAVPDMQIKVAGGIGDRKTAEAFISAGANRLGTSHAIEIVSSSSKTQSQSGSDKKSQE